MIFLRPLRFFCTLCLLTASFSFGYFHKNEAGKEIFSFANTFQSPRSAALQFSNGANPTKDPGITMLNPASLEMVQGKSNTVALHWQTGEFADNEGLFSATHAFGNMLLQANYGWIAYGDIDGMDESGNATGETHSPKSQLGSVTLAFPLPHFRFGTTAKFVSDFLSGNVGDRTAMGVAFDWGILWLPDTPRFGVGISARDFGTMFRDYIADGDNECGDYAMAETFALSAFYKPGALPRFAITGETTFPRYSEPALRLGGEYALGRSFFIRAGFTRTWLDISRDAKEIFNSSSRPDESNESQFLSAGLGYDNSTLAIDYAFSYLAQGLGTEHRIGLRFYF